MGRGLDGSWAEALAGEPAVSGRSANPPFLGAHMGGVLGTLEAFFCEKSAAIHPGQRDPPSVAPGQRDPPSVAPGQRDPPSVALVVVPAAAGREDDEAPHCAPLLASKYARGSMVLRRLDHAFRAGLAHKHTRRPDQVHDPPTTSPTVASSLRPTLPSPPTSQPPLPTPRPADPPDSPRYPPDSSCPHATTRKCTCSRGIRWSRHQRKCC